MPSWRRLSWCHEWDSGRGRLVSRHAHARPHPHSHQLRASSSPFSPSVAHVHVTHCTARHAHERYMMAPLLTHHAPSLAGYPRTPIGLLRPKVDDRALLASTARPSGVYNPPRLRSLPSREEQHHVISKALKCIPDIPFAHTQWERHLITFLSFFPLTQLPLRPAKRVSFRYVFFSSVFFSASTPKTHSLSSATQTQSRCRSKVPRPV